ncbi:protein RGF1 INDUCIBLE TRANSCRIPTION FACTOR 1 isoform X2 [Lactuca sativa]|uniref:protein RGF1 INDUCIBLE TRANSCRIPTION FACTOR 1 isoform X2 n=1 Tax=Lactuca sativa TaxID=4236 RepID=UPI000CD7ED76|nr:protein RGF1 INDUCIBLE TRANSCRIPTION FACTOR 1 isoform X2 [Lactuca sativa]
MQQLVPPWLEKLLSTDFFSVCRTHGDAARSERNMFCLDCNDEAFCFYCRSSRHKEHKVIQIRRSSYHDVVRVSEIEKVLEIDGVQTYVINSAKVLFLNERPQPKSSSSSGKGGSHICEVCGRSLLDTFRFCSLGCKLVGIKRNGNANFMLEGRSTTTTRVMVRGEEERLMYPSTPPSTRRRKGIPHRAPN